jgi:TrpR-related protein YerC/YecD
METKHTYDLFDTLLLLESREEALKFFKDLCTPQEIEDLQERWRVCQLLEGESLSYREIHKQTRASLTTIGRVARFLKTEPYQGYTALLQKVKSKKAQLSDKRSSIKHGENK